MIRITTYLMLNCIASFVCMLLVSTPVLAQVPPVAKISNTQGQTSFTLDEGDRFGGRVALLGDLDGDGVPDLAVGAEGDDDSRLSFGIDKGAVYILFLNRDGTVKRHQKISDTEGNFEGELNSDSRFGGSVASLGDLDGDGVPDLAVGAYQDGEWYDGINCTRCGSVYMLFLNRDGTVKRHQKIDNHEGGLGGTLVYQDSFGSWVAPWGDADGDGIPDLAVGASNPHDGGIASSTTGEIWLLNLNRDGTVNKTRNVRSNLGIPGAQIIPFSGFGTAILRLDDLDGNGADDLAVSLLNAEALWILLMNPDGSVLDKQEITNISQGTDRGSFGISMAGVGDVDGNGVTDLAVGTYLDDDGGGDRGGVYLLFLNQDGTLKSKRKISSTPQGFTGDLGDGDNFGYGLAAFDLEGDGSLELAVGTWLDDDGATDSGALWILNLDAALASEVAAISLAPEQPVVGKDVTVSARILDLSGTGTTEALVNFRRAGDATLFSAPMTPQGNEQFQFTIPAFAVSERGVEYFISTTNGVGNTTRAPESGILSVPVHLPDGVPLPLHAGTAADAYRLVSIPLHLEETDARTVLETSLGPYDIKRWRFYDHIRGNTFNELGTEPVSLTPGRAYWMLAKDPGQVFQTGPGTSLPTNDVFRLPLQKGWNPIGNPFTFPLPLSHLALVSGETVDVRQYDGTWSEADSVLVPFEGYAVFVEKALDTLLVYPTLPEGIPVARSKRAGESSAEAAWSIAIKARAGLARDTDNRIIVNAEADSGFDPMDRPEPPVIGDYVSVSFPHEDWQHTAQRYSTDARPPNDGETTWTFEVRTHQPERVELSFEGLADVPENYGVWLIDDLVSVWQDLRENPRYAVGTGGETAEGRQLKLVVAPATEREGSAEVPQQFALSQNFPNPFNPSTTLRYGVPEASQVRVAVYDVLGRQVAVLVEGAVPAGRHVVVSDGRSDAGAAVGSGVYLVRMEAGAFTQTRTMMMVK